MNLKLAFFILFIISMNLKSQDYIDKITLQTCDCMKKISDTTNYEKLTMELGLCMISAAEPYKKQLKKDYGINLNNMNESEGEALGKVLGMKMATACPESLMKMYGKVNSNDKESTTQLESIGKITNIERDVFVIFSVFDNSGKSMKFYWLEPVESNVDLANNYRTFIETTVKIKYGQKEFFDPKIGEYRNFNIIHKMDKVFQ